MYNHINALRQKACSKIMEDSIYGIEELISIANNVNDILLEALKSSGDRFVVAEKISQSCYNYLQKLRGYVDGTDKDLSFWAATLIVHNEANDGSAEKILLDAVFKGELDKAYIATTILCRVKNPNVREAILERLKDASLSDETKNFFREKLSI